MKILITCKHINIFCLHFSRKPELSVQLPVSATCCRVRTPRFSLLRAPLCPHFTSPLPRRPCEASCRSTLPLPKKHSSPRCGSYFSSLFFSRLNIKASAAASLPRWYSRNWCKYVWQEQALFDITQKNILITVSCKNFSVTFGPINW